MKTNVYFFIAALCLIFYACNSDKKEEPQTKLYEPIEETITIDPVERGAYLVNTNGCHDCHSPKKMTEKGMELDTDRLLSGHPSDEKLPEYDTKTAQGYILFSMGLTSATGPWGTSFAANLTPDATGIGAWTEAQFLNAIKKGLYKGLEDSRPLLPPMPWEHYANFTDDDLKAIFAYLKSMKPVENIVPSAIIAEAPPQ
ncbi:cytochrome c [Flavobacteriaceae bacterium XHP0103]|uniref:c-type cytochrome n=1 Tax=Marixanthotalea marina TaxID=2844359 RepID=UPI002989FAC6|nr:c-type cytochrome [Marixanthotalea marina]MBU3822021.1 cytochrome c [Marixanthotalea marina]